MHQPALGRWRACVVLCLAGSLRCSSQTTQGLIAGTVIDVDTRTPVAGAAVTYFRGDSNSGAATARTDAQGFYAFSFVPPGTYRIRVCAAESCSANAPPSGAYQRQEIYQLDLPVAARLEVNFALRKLSDVWRAGVAQGLYRDSTTAIVRYYAADVAQLRSAYVQLVPYQESSFATTLSYVADPASIANLPLNGRDIYTALMLLPGVTADTGTARGLGLSVNGQRPSASNYLLDGVENNNTAITGPLTTLAPEMVQEYRVSTNSWSAEYGGSAGFLANAITRAGGDRWHGAAYFNLKNDALDANTFQSNALSLPRSPFKESQYGFQTSGPVIPHRLYLSAGLELYRSRSSQAQQTLTVPSPLFVASLSSANPAKQLFTQFPTPATTPGDGNVSQIAARPPVSFDRKVGLARADYVSGPRRLMLRAAVNQFDWPDFIWYPYPDFTSGLSQPLISIALNYTDSVRPGLTQDLHAAWSSSATRWDRAHPEIPTIVVGGAAPGQTGPLMPGSPAFYAFHDSIHQNELSGVWSWVRARHIVKFGGGALLRQSNTLETAGQGGEVVFDSLGALLLDQPSSYTAALSRTLPQFQLPAFGRTYGVHQYSLFGEDTWRATPRLTIDLGLRWEFFGAPVNVGSIKGDQVRLGSGADFVSRLESASLAQPSSGDQPLYSATKASFSPRVGFAWDSRGHLPVVRGGYGIFYDRPFDNLFDVGTNNIVVPPSIPCNTGGGNVCRPTSTNPLGFLAPVNSMLALLKGSPVAQSFPKLILIDPQLHNGYTQSYFLGLQKRLAESWDVELNGAGALGRRLLTTDVVNRALSTPVGPFNPSLPEILWRSNQGSSDYNALSAVARYRSSRDAAQISYTWSHSIDYQSDPLAGDYFDLSFTNIAASGEPAAQAAFTQQFNSRADRATSDLDQRHNLVFYSWWNVPSASGSKFLRAATRGWRVSQMAAFRSGFPYTVRSAATGAILNQRANIVQPDAVWAAAGAPAKPGAVAILNPSAFAAPPNGVVGNSGRNAFEGPGLWNIDLSAARSFDLRFLGDSGRVLLRADFFNALNHANLDNPNALVGSAGFGQASHGRQDYNTGFPAQVPFRETARQIQMILKVEF